jgi:hypothetical protein
MLSVGDRGTFKTGEFKGRRGRSGQKFTVLELFPEGMLVHFDKDPKDAVEWRKRNPSMSQHDQPLWFNVMVYFDEC